MQDNEYTGQLQHDWDDSTRPPWDQGNSNGGGGGGERRSFGDASIHQHLGRLEGRMDGLEERQTRFEMRTDSSLGEMNGKLDHLIETTATRKAEKQATWKVVTAVGSAIVFLASVFAWGVNKYIELRVDPEPEIPEEIKDIFNDAKNDGE